MRELTNLLLGVLLNIIATHGAPAPEKDVEPIEVSAVATVEPSNPVLEARPALLICPQVSEFPPQPKASQPTRMSRPRKPDNRSVAVKFSRLDAHL